MCATALAVPSHSSAGVKLGEPQFENGTTALAVPSHSSAGVKLGEPQFNAAVVLNALKQICVRGECGTAVTGYRQSSGTLLKS
jgi:hypothetical protein